MSSRSAVNLAKARASDVVLSKAEYQWQDDEPAGDAVATGALVHAGAISLGSGRRVDLAVPGRPPRMVLRHLQRVALPRVGRGPLRHGAGDRGGWRLSCDDHMKLKALLTALLLAGCGTLIIAFTLFCWSPAVLALLARRDARRGDPVTTGSISARRPGGKDPAAEDLGAPVG